MAGGRSASARAAGSRLGLSQQVFVLSVVIVAIVVGVGVVVDIVAADRLVHRGAERRVESVAESVASMPDVAAALHSDDPSATLQPLAERLRHRTDVSFVVFMTPDGIRYSHPNRAKIGGHFAGTFEPAARGGTVVETFKGSLGPSVRAVVPIYDGNGDSDDGGAPVGLVSVGVTVNTVTSDVSYVLPLILGTAVVALAVAALGSLWIARRLRRQTFGMGAAELAGVYAHHDAVLHAVREGLVVIDGDGRIALINDAARQLFGLGDVRDIQGRPAGVLPVTGSLAELLASGDTVEDEVHLAGERLVVVTQVPIGPPPGSRSKATKGRASLGTVMTIRDHSEIKSLADELSATRSLADALRASNHESANRLHTVVMLAQLGDVDAAVRLATGEVRATRMLTSRLSGQFEEAALVALLLGKASEAAQRSIELNVTEASWLPEDAVEPVDLVTIVGNLVDNAMDAATAGPEHRRVEVSIEPQCDRVVVKVRDSGPGFSPEALDHVFEPGWSTKVAGPDRRHGRGIGMALVRQVVARLGGAVDVANSGPDDELPGAIVTVHLPIGATAQEVARVREDARAGTP